MTTKRGHNHHVSLDEFTETVLKCVKETLEDSDSKILRYEPIKASARNKENFISHIDATDSEWKEKYQRRQENLSTGFFCEKTKPYQSLGEIHMQNGNLLLEGLTDQVKSKIKQRPSHCYSEEHALPSSSKEFVNEEFSPTIEMYPILPKKDPTGFNIIQHSLDKIIQIEKKIFGRGCINDYLTDQIRYADSPFSNTNDTNTKEKMQSKDNVKLCLQDKQSKALTKLDQSSLKEERKTSKTTTTRMDNDEKKAEMERHSFQNKEIKKSDLSFLNEKESEKESTKEKRQEIRAIKQTKTKLLLYRQEKRIEHMKAKLSAINSIFCALFNMKVKQIKQHFPLSNKAAIDYLATNVFIDELGRPVAWKQVAPGLVSDERSLMDDASSPGAAVHETKSLSVFLGPRKPSISHVSVQINSPDKGDFLKYFDTRSNPESTSRKPSFFYFEGDKLISGFHGKKGRRDALEQLLAENPTPWLHVTSIERRILEKKRRKRFFKNADHKNTPEEGLNELRQEYFNLQERLKKETEEEYRKLEIKRKKTLTYKFKALRVNELLPHKALEKMREEAKEKTKERVEVLIQPKPWFKMLRREIRKEQFNWLYQDILSNISRFQFENEKSIPHAKEKICLLIMSLPAYILLTTAMLEAMFFFVKEVLGSPGELLHHWLAQRKFNKLSHILKKQKWNSNVI